MSGNVLLCWQYYQKAFQLKMNLAKELSNRVRQVFLDGTWIANTNYNDQLIELNWEQAVVKFENLNSVAALTYHINYYLAGILNVFKGGKLEIHDKYSFDMPAVTSESDWALLRESLFKNAASFAQYVEGMDDVRLEEDFVDKKYGSYIRNIEGVIEHSYYHLGQVSLIIKLLKDKT
ncbi:MAG: DUF1572 domain-containing protein [Chitinophagales bacterium]